jgi:hypothetical protein
MHESLKRPLFRKKAMEVYQAKQGGKVPGYVYGALIQGARVAYPFIARQFARPTVQKGLLALEGAGIAAGVEETKRGIKGEESIYSAIPGLEGEEATIAGGLATLIPGVGFAGKTLTRAFPTSTTAAGAAQAMTTKFPFSYPGTTAFLGIPLTAAEAKARDAINYETQTRVPKADQEKVVNLEKQISNLPENATIRDAADLILNADISDAAKDKVLIEKLQLSPQAVASLKEKRPEVKIQPSEQGTKLASDKTIEQNIQAQMNFGVNPNNMSPEAQKELAVKQVRQQEGATREIEKLLNEKKDDNNFKQQFSNLKNQIQSVTGEDSMSNLVLLKMAAGMLTGKTTQRGVAGLLDVVGQAAGPAIDTAILLANQQKEFDKDLALALIKNRAEQTAGSKAAPGLVYYREENIDPVTKKIDPDFPIIGKVLRQDKDTGAALEIMSDPEKGEYFAPYKGAGTPFVPNQKLKNRAEQQMRERETIIEMSNLVTSIDEKFLGPKPTAMKYVRAIDGTINSFTNGKYANSEAFITGTYDQILNNITDPGQYEGMSDAMKTDRSKANDKLITQFKKENDEILKEKLDALKKGDEERVAQANLSFIENRMKYSQANSNKFEDRVNQYDVISAERDTKIYKLISDPRQIKINYEKIGRDANQNFGKDAARYVANAGRINDVVGLYPTVPWVKEYVGKTQQKSTKQSQQPDVTRNLMEQFYGVK